MMWGAFCPSNARSPALKLTPFIAQLPLKQSSDDLDLQIKIVIGRSLFDLIGDHFLPFF